MTVKPPSNPASPETTTPPPEPNSPPPKSRPPRWLGSLATIWLALVLAIWFALHRPFSLDVPFVPFSAEIPLALGRTVGGIVLLLLILLASGALGRMLLNRLLKEQELTKLEQTLFEVGLGLGLNGFLMLGLGLLGLLNQPIAYTLLVLELALGVKYQVSSIKYQIKDFRSRYSSFPPLSSFLPPLSSFLLAAYIAFVALVTLLLALAPPLAWDAQLYHLTGPKLYIEAGRVLPIRDLVFTNYPFGVEMLYTWGMLLLNDGLAQAIHWAFGLLGGLAVFAFARRFFNHTPKAARLAMALYLAVPLVQVLMSWAYTDLAVTFYTFMAFYALLLAFKLKNSAFTPLIILAGICMGLAFGGKYTAVLALPGLMAVLVAQAAVVRLNWLKVVRGLFVFGLSFSLVILPWLLRNFFFSDNPVAPLLFGARGWDKAELAEYVGTSGAASFSPFELIKLPFSLVVEGTTGGKYDATLNPLFLAFAPLILLVVWRERKRAGLWEIALALGMYYLCWLATVLSSPLAAQARMLLPAFPLLALLTAYALAELPKLKLGILSSFAKLALALYLGLNVLTLTLSFVAFDPLPVLSGLQSRDTFLEQNLGSYYRAARFVSSNLPADAYVHTFFEPRTYYFNRRAAPDVNLRQFLFYYTHNSDAASFNAVLKQRGATHVLISERGERFLLTTPEYGQVNTLTQAQPLLNELQTKYWKLLYREEGEFAVYEVK